MKERAFRNRCAVLAGTLAIVLLPGCAQTENGGQRVEDTCPPLPEPQATFPAERTASPDRVGPYESLLRVGHFSPLWCGPGAAEVYRLLAPSFAAPLIVVATRTARGWSVTAAEYYDTGAAAQPRGGPIWSVIKRTEVEVPETAGKGLETWLRRAGFWDSSPLRQLTQYESSKMSVTVIEARRNGRYSVLGSEETVYGPFADSVKTLVIMAGRPLPREVQERRGWNGL